MLFSFIISKNLIKIVHLRVNNLYDKIYRDTATNVVFGMYLVFVWMRHGWTIFRYGKIETRPNDNNQK